MIQMEELIYSLTSVIIRYLDSQDEYNKIVQAPPEEHINQTRDYSKKIFSDSGDAIKEKLDKLIEIHTESYPTRRPLLKYFSNEIQFLKNQIDRTTPYTHEEFDSFEKQITQLLFDFKTLLYTPKGIKCSIMLHPCVSTGKETLDPDYILSLRNPAKESSITLNGLKSPPYMPKTFCTSGDFLIQEFTEILYFPLEKADKLSLEKFAKTICADHQKKLISSEDERIRLELSSKDQVIKYQASQIEDQDSKLKEHEATIEKLQQQLIESSKLIEQLRMEISDKDAKYRSICKGVTLFGVNTNHFNKFPPKKEAEEHALAGFSQYMGL